MDEYDDEYDESSSYDSDDSINTICDYCDGDINQEVDPWLILSIYEYYVNFSLYDLDKLHQNTFIDDIIDNIEINMYFKRYYGNNKEQINKCKNRFFSIFSSSLIRNKNDRYKDYNIDNIEDLFTGFCHDVSVIKCKFNDAIKYLSKLIEKELAKEPIETRYFPRFISTESQDDEELLIKILEKKDENREEESATLFSYDDLLQFYEVLSKNTKSFSISPKLVNLALKKFDDFLNALQSKAKNSDEFSFNYFRTIDSESDEFHCFILILLIKLRLYMINRQMQEFLTVLLQLIIIEEQEKLNDQFSFKYFINEILPECKTRRTTIIKNEQIIDFSFSNDRENDYILTKNGVFKVQKNTNQQMEQIYFNTEEENQKIIQLLKQSNKGDAKIYFSNGILYLFIVEEKSIHKIIVSVDEELLLKKQNKKKKIENSEKYSDKNKQSKINKKKEKRQKRKMERFNDDDDEKREIDLESIQVNIPNYPVLSFGVYNNYIRIVQRKSFNDNKVIFTNIDLTPNDRFNYDNEESFNYGKIDKKFTQTQIEIEIKENIQVDGVLLSENFVYFVFNKNSFLQKWMIMDNGELKLEGNVNSPFIFNSDSIIKMDNKKFLYYFVALKNDDDFGSSITQMYLPETHHFLREENNLFLKYPFLQNLSNIINNCSQVIMNKDNISKITRSEFSEKYKKENDEKNPFQLSVDPDEICSLAQPIHLIVPNLENIKMLIKNLKNENLKRFFIALFIKMIGINFKYDVNMKTLNGKIEETVINNLKSIKLFILDLYSLYSSDSIDSDIIIRESMIFTLSICGKYLFFPDLSYNELHKLMDQLLIFKGENSKIILKSLSSFIFSSISSLYIIDHEIYNKLNEMKNEIDLTSLFKKNILYILFESTKPLRSHCNNYDSDALIKAISPYIKVLFKHFRSILIDESNSFNFVEDFLLYILCLNTENVYLSLILEKELIDINFILYDRISKIPGVVRKDQEFLEKNQDIKKQDFNKEIKIVESKHPYNQEPVPMNQTKKNEKFYFEDLGTFVFGEKIKTIYVQISHESKIHHSDSIFIFDDKLVHIFQIDDETLNRYYEITSNKIRIKIGRNIKESQKNKEKLWGFKLILTGVEPYNPFWNPDHYLSLYGMYIVTLMDAFSRANKSTKLKKAEKDFKLILNDNIIQGITSEDIDNYESNISNESMNERKISRGISRGISYDSQEESHYDIKIKKQFLNDIISIKDDQTKTYAKRFLDFLYKKTAQKNRIKLNNSTQFILESEHLFAACLFKQLGLITTCLDLSKVINVTKIDDINSIEFPSFLLSLWRKIYSLRNTLFYEYLKSKSNKSKNDSESNFDTLLKNVNQKCKLLLYSDSILHFKEKEDVDNESLEEASKSILSFVTSKIPLSDINKLINIRTKRLSISKQSLVYLLSFFDQNKIFESSKAIFSCCFISNPPIDDCLGAKQHEIEDYKNLLCLLVYKITKNIYTQPSISMITQPYFIVNTISHLKKNESTIQMYHVLFDMLNENKNNKSFFKKMINNILVYILIMLSLQIEDDELINKIVSLVTDKEIDLDSISFILISIPALIQFTQVSENCKIFDEKFVLSIINNMNDSARIVYCSFYWAEFLISNEKEKNQKHQDFILKILKGIGQTFVNKGCLFINDSYEHESHQKVASFMVFFIRLLYNENNVNLLEVIHDILTNKINEIEKKEECLMITIGLFISFESNLLNSFPIKLNNFDNKKVEKKKYMKYCVLLENKNFKLNDKEIDNILKLHEFLIQSDFLNDNKIDQNCIKYKEIIQSILITSFYSFLPIIMQIQNNAKLLLNETNIKRSLSIFEFAMRSIPSKSNSVKDLASNLEEKINGVDSIVIKNDFCNSFKFLRMNFGEVVYSNGNGNDKIKTNKNFLNVFICNKPFYFEYETYFEIKANENNCKNVFIGFIDSEEKKYENAFGFGCIGYDEIFCRRSPLLSYDVIDPEDDVMKKEKLDDKILIKKGDIIGCYYTQLYSYLTINGKLTPYRISNKTLKSYIPIIIVDHEQCELEIIKNVQIVDKSDMKFDFLNVNNVSNEFFEEKDIKSYDTGKFEYIYHMGVDNKKNSVPLIGSKIKISPMHFSETDIESIDVYPSELFDLLYTDGIITDITPLNEYNQFIYKYRVEFFNYVSLKTYTGEYDSRLFTFSNNNFYEKVSKLTGLNHKIDDFDLKELPKNLQCSSNLKLIHQYITNKVIKDNSKSIAIIMTRYLVFILIDYLRYSKSKLLQDEGISSKEMQMIIKSLAFSLPTITQFDPVFDSTINEHIINKYIIFSDEQNETEIEVNVEEEDSDDYSQLILFKIPGDSYMFNYSFKIFLKKSESFISSHFMPSLIKQIYENTLNNSLSINQIYDLIHKNDKIDSFSPLPDSFFISSSLSTKNDIVGFIPILVSSIPEQLPSIKCYEKSLRISSEKVSYFRSISDNSRQKFIWEYKIDKLENKNFDRNYKLKFGLLYLSDDLDEIILKSPLGFIQIIFNVFQSFLNSKSNEINDFCYDILEFIFNISLKKDILAYPFIHSIIVLILSINDFSSYLSLNNIFESFSCLSNYSIDKICRMEKHPNSSNEIPLIFSLYSNLILSLNDEEKLTNKSLLFDKYLSLNNVLFDVLENKQNRKFFSEGFTDITWNRMKKKNYKLLYNLYYYSILLRNEIHFPYPKFLFVHDLIRQHFGGFRKVITKAKINKIEKNEQNEICYKSDVLNNENDLYCSFKLVNILIKNEFEGLKRYDNYFQSYQIFRIDRMKSYTEEKNKVDNNNNKKEKDENENNDGVTYSVFVHQLNDDRKIEVPQSCNGIVLVSFPLEILIYKKGDSKTEEIDGRAFVIDFNPSEEQKRQYFVDHYDEIQDDFNQFISLGKYDNELSGIAFAKTEKDKNDETLNEEQVSIYNSNNNENQNSNEHEEDNGDSNENQNNNNEEEDNGDSNESQENDSNNDDDDDENDDFKFFAMDQIPKELKSHFSPHLVQFKPNIVSLRLTIISHYSSLIEYIMSSYSDGMPSYMYNGHLNWTISLPSKDKLQDLYTQQIIRPACSMNTESKLKFINEFFLNDIQGIPQLNLVFNRFEQRKFFEKYEINNNHNNNEEFDKAARPLFVQFIEQVDDNSIDLLKVRGKSPFSVELMGENSIDAGGPSREIFSTLITEMMNNHIGIFTFNPNRRHNVHHTNQEDLIPNKKIDKDVYKDYDKDIYYIMESSRFIYAGALIAVCIVSNIPQQMKLASFIWEYLSLGTVSIKNIYEIDNNFKEVIDNAENILKRIKSSSSMTDDEFESLFLRSFDIHDSFDNIVELVPSGSKKKVTIENLSDFIELAKSYRIHEFDQELKNLKKGFDSIMCYKNITNILNPNELKLLICGEPNCSVEQMKNLCVVNVINENPQNAKKMIKMFWNVIDSLSLKQRIMFIKFSSGNMGLPAPGLRWESDIEVNILPKENTQSLAKSQTCFSRINIPYFESEEQLAKVLKISIENSDVITDSHETMEDVAEFL